MTTITEANAIKVDFERVARRWLKTTPEYATALEDGRGRAHAWLVSESESMAEFLYASMTTRELEE